MKCNSITVSPTKVSEMEPSHKQVTQIYITVILQEIAACNIERKSLKCKHLYLPKVQSKNLQIDFGNAENIQRCNSLHFSRFSILFALRGVVWYFL